MKSFLESFGLVVLFLLTVGIGVLLGWEANRSIDTATTIDWRVAAPHAVAELRSTKHEPITGEEYHSFASCVVINSDTGLALTCAHVVRDAEGLSVDLPNGLTATVRVLVEDDDRDIAVVLLPVHSFTAMPLAPDGSTKLGDVVYEMGYPQDVGLTLTSGVLSASDKKLSLREGKPGLAGILQHSCPTSPGNSGGPLIDVRGRVIGLTVAMDTDAACVAFTIPVSQLREELDAHDDALHPYR